MLRFMIPLTLTLVSTARSAQEDPQWFVANQAVASESQIKYAIENKYDDTGPGAKGPEFAYNAYKNLEDALIAYLDDPDTELPEHERERAINKLLNQQPAKYEDLQTFYPKTIQEYTVNQQTIENKYSEKAPTYFQRPVSQLGYEGSNVDFLKLENKPIGTYKLQHIRPVKGNPLSVAHYTRDSEDSSQDQITHPKYAFSYGVHDKATGDSKTAQEIRDGSTVRGYYSFMDADGKQRVVHYTANDKLGFRATVHRTGSEH